MVWLQPEILRNEIDVDYNEANNNNGGDNNELALDPNNVQDASKATGQEGGDDPAQADSQTDNANFINFCTGKTITNGAQVQAGSCNGIVMGDIPSQQNMVSSIITSPGPGEDIAADTEFSVKLQVANLEAGSFTSKPYSIPPHLWARLIAADPQNTYYAAPQQLNNGNIVGHTHVTIQKISDTDFNPDTPPDAANFAFFKGINNADDGAGNLEAVVDEGLPAVSAPIMFGQAKADESLGVLSGVYDDFEQQSSARPYASRSERGTGWLPKVFSWPGWKQ
jgi:transcription initiation factor TFIID subunit 15